MIDNCSTNDTLMPIFVVKMILVERFERFFFLNVYHQWLLECSRDHHKFWNFTLLCSSCFHNELLENKVECCDDLLRTREIVDRPIANSLLQINKLQPCTILYKTQVTHTFIKINSKYCVSYLQIKILKQLTIVNNVCFFIQKFCNQCISSYFTKKKMGIQVIDPCFTKLPSYLITPLNLNESYDDVNTKMYLK
jgi:hypothetical protein